MARIRYGCYLHNRPHCYVISNANQEFAEDVTEESFSNPPIKLTIKALDPELEMETFDANENSLNHPELQDNLTDILLEKFTGWRLTGVNINSNGMYLMYATKHPAVVIDGEEYGDGQVCVYGNYTLFFEVNHNNDLPLKQYEVNVSKLHNGCSTITRVCITEFVEKYKQRKLEMQSDNHGQPWIDGQQYCIITEY